MRTLTKRISIIDPLFAPVIANSPLCDVGITAPRRTHYQTLVHSILSQQLATKAAETIITRVTRISHNRITPQRIHALTLKDLRNAGVSEAKARSIKELTVATLNREIPFHKFGTLTNEEITETLTSIFGIGRWTSEMFLIFHLGRLDIWPTGDLGVRRGWEQIHALRTEITPKELETHRTLFQGFESVVAWYCWRALEGDN